MKACGNDMKNKKMLKIITLSLTFWASFVVSTQTLAREKGILKTIRKLGKLTLICVSINDSQMKKILLR